MQAFILLNISMKIENVGWITGFSQSTLYNLKKQALEKEYDPIITPVIYNVYVENTHKSRRPGINLKK